MYLYLFFFFGRPGSLRSPAGLSATTPQALANGAHGCGQ